MLPLNFGAPTGNPVYTKQELNSFLPNPNVTGLLGPALNFNAPNTPLPNSYKSAYAPQQWNGPDPFYQMMTALTASNHPLFRLMAQDYTSGAPKINWTITS